MWAKIAILAGVCGVLGFIIWRVTAVSHAHPTQGVQVASPFAEINAGPPPSARVNLPAPKPIGPINAIDQRNPRHWEGSPLLRASLDKGGAWEEWRPEQVKRVLTVYRAFVADAHLTEQQREKFDTIIEDTRKMYFQQADRVLKKNLGAEELAAGKEAIESDAYERVRLLLTPDQYDVFLREIGGRFTYMVIALENVPRS
jgi:hypothetical protein